MTEDKLTYSSVSISILQDMLSEFTQDIICKSLLKEKVTEERYGTVKDPKLIDSRNKKRKEEEGEVSVSLTKKKHSNGSHSHSNGESSRSDTPQPGDLQRDPDIGRFTFDVNGHDVYENALRHNGALIGEKAAASFKPTNGTDIYFRCQNCQREIAGSRFAAHIDKCFGGRSRRN